MVEKNLSGISGGERKSAKELGRDGIFTNVVMLGWTMTEKALKTFPQEMIEQERQKIPTGKHSVPDDIANLVLFLAPEANGIINGEFIRVTGGK
jgi:NAD(P)-dependent dehydrogenase (short-subunit alcohol dehydrogenase family)